MSIELKIAGSDVVALIDEKFSHLQRYRWRLSAKGYVFRHGEQVIRLAHVVAGRPLPGFVVSYMNGNSLDCRSKNLICIPHTYHRQLGNRRLSRRNKSGFRGVHFDESRGKWCAVSTVHGKVFRLGRFNTPDEAAVAVADFRKINVHMSTQKGNYERD